jgi:hypothetical protein
MGGKRNLTCARIVNQDAFGGAKAVRFYTEEWFVDLVLFFGLRLVWPMRRNLDLELSEKAKDQKPSSVRILLRLTYRNVAPAEAELA